MSRIIRKKRSEKTESPRLSFLHIFTLGSLIGLIFGAVVVFKGFYIDHWQSPPVRAIARIVPIPVASVGGDWIMYDDVVEVAALLSTIEDNSDISDFDRALEIVIRRQHVEHLGEAMGVEQPISTETLDVDTDFLEAVGWNRNMYEKIVYEPLLYAQEVEEAIYDSDELQKPAYDRIASIEQSVELGVSFTDLAIQQSEGGAAAAGGDVGYLKKEDFAPGLESLFDVETGEVSEILEADRYFAMGYVYDAIEVEEERVQVGIQMISINKLSLAEVLEDYMETQEVKVYLK